MVKAAVPRLSPARRVLDAVGVGRLIMAAALALYFLPLAVGKDQRFRLGVFPLPTKFLDLHSVTAGWECSRDGIDVLRADPCDPLHRPFNYPRIWLLPKYLGLGQGDTVVLGVLLAVVFLATVLVLAGRVSWWRGLIWAAVVVSPPVMYGVERGNIDLAVFVVLAAGVFLLRPRAVLGSGLFLLAGVLKLFPVFGFGALLQERGRRLWLAAGVAAGFLAYCLATLHDLRLIKKGTPNGDLLAYGAAVFRDAIVGYGDRSAIARALPALIVIAALAVAGALLQATRRSWFALAAAPSAELTGFWAGAGIYVGTYAFLYDADYRLVFLLLALPQLLRWAAERQAVVPFARLGIGLLLLALWFSTDSRYVPAVGWIWTHWNAHVRVHLDTVFQWLLFAYLLGALLAALPPALRLRRRTMAPQ